MTLYLASGFSLDRQIEAANQKVPEAKVGVVGVDHVARVKKGNKVQEE